MSLAEKVGQAGVGPRREFHVRRKVITNGAECKPLLHKDAVIMEEQAAGSVEKMLLAMEAVEAKDAVIGIKGKEQRALETVAEACKGTPILTHLPG